MPDDFELTAPGIINETGKPLSATEEEERNHYQGTILGGEMVANTNGETWDDGRLKDHQFYLKIRTTETYSGPDFPERTVFIGMTDQEDHWAVDPRSNGAKFVESIVESPYGVSLDDLTDLVGVQVEVMHEKIRYGNGNLSRRAHPLVKEVVGVDNDMRASAGLEPRELGSLSPAAEGVSLD